MERAFPPALREQRRADRRFGRRGLRRREGCPEVFDAIRTDQFQIACANGLKEIRITGLGAAAYGVASANPVPDGVRSVQISWREGRFVSTVEASGFTRRMSVADEVALARKQDDRLR